MASLTTILTAAALAGALLLGSCTSTRSTSKVPTAQEFATDEQQIRAVLSTQTAAWNRGDIPGFMQGYWQSDSLLFIGKKGPTRGWQNTLDNYRRNYPDGATMGQLTFSQLRIQPVSPDVAHVIGRWHLGRPTAGNVQGWFTLLFRRLDGRWVIVADHSS